MKKWMALLLCCLLCLCAAGAMAEGAVTLSLDNGNQIDIYPNGYKLNGNFTTYTGPYIITGKSENVDTCLDFYSIPHEAPPDTEPVTYTVIFQNVTINMKSWYWYTAVRFGHDEKNNGQNITLNLNDVTTGNQTLTITQDTSKAQTAIKDWVNAYNSLIDTFSSLTKYTAVDAGADSQSSSNGALLGDSTLRTIQTQLKSMLSNTVSSSSYKTLAQIGITTDPSDGKLELDADKLTAALKKDASGVGALIVGDGKKTGITTTIGSNLTSWLSTTGIIKAATDGVSKTLNKLTKDYNAASDRIDAQVARYKEQFTQLDVLMTSLNSTSSYLTQQFENNSNSK